MDKHLLSIKKTKTLVSFKAPMQWRLQGLEQGRHELEMFQHWVLLTWWHRSHPKCPRGSLVFKELQNGSKPTWHVLLKSIALSHASCVGLHGVTDKLHSVSVVSHGIDPSPRQTTKKCNSKIWLEDPTPKRTLPKWCRCLPGSHFGKSYRFKLKKKKNWRATNMHVYLLLGPTMKRSPILVPFTFKGPKERERNQCFETGKHISDTRVSMHYLSKDEVDHLPHTSYARTACGWTTLVINVSLSQGRSDDIQHV